VDIDVAEFNGTKAEIEDLRKKLDGPAEVQFDRAALRAGLTMIRDFKNGSRMIDDPASDVIVFEYSPTLKPLITASDPAGVRSALRKLGVERIICKPVTDRWDFEGIVNLARLVSNIGSSAGPFEAPI